MRILLTVLGVVVAAIAAVFVVAAVRPGDYSVSRTLHTSAAPERVFAVIGDFHRFAEWSPWQSLDPAMKTTLEGPPATVGSSNAWEGNDQVGAGKMTITEVRPGEAVVMRLDFLRPYPSTSTATWSVKATPDGGSDVTWSMHGRNDALMGKVFAMLAMDKMLGGTFERGLAALKGVVERNGGT